MTNHQSLITPPPELVDQWMGLLPALAIEAAFQAGADQELEACCKWLAVAWKSYAPTELRAARRPKPPSLKEKALGLLNEGPVSELLDHEVDTIRRALEQLDD